MPNSSTQSTEIPEEASAAAWSTACSSGLVIDVESDQSDLDDVVAAAAPALRKQGAEEERERLKEWVEDRKQTIEEIAINRDTARSNLCLADDFLAAIDNQEAS